MPWRGNTSFVGTLPVPRRQGRFPLPIAEGRIKTFSLFLQKSCYFEGAINRLISKWQRAGTCEWRKAQEAGPE